MILRIRMTLICHYILYGYYIFYIITIIIASYLHLIRLEQLTFLILHGGIRKNIYRYSDTYLQV